MAAGHCTRLPGPSGTDGRYAGGLDLMSAQHVIIHIYSHHPFYPHVPMTSSPLCRTLQDPTPSFRSSRRTLSVRPENSDGAGPDG